MRLEGDIAALDVPGVPPQRRSHGEVSLGLRERVEDMFAPVARSPITPASVLLAVLCVVLTAGYSVLRVGGAGPFNSVWAEDGGNFLSDAYMFPVGETIFRPVNGYFLVLPRLIAAVTAYVPVAWGPAVLTGGAALVSAAMVVMVYVASGSVLRRPLLRVAASFWVVAAPLAESTFTFGPNMVAPLQFVLLYGLFWALLWTPVRRSARILQIVFVLACVMSTFLAVLFLPVAVLRWWACRGRLPVVLTSLLVAGAAFQTTGLLLGLSTRVGISHPRPDPVWAVVAFVRWALPFGVVGERTMHDAGFVVAGVHTGGGGPWYWGGVVFTWLVVLAVVTVAARGITRPHWTFAVVAWSTAVLLLCAQVMIQGRLELRYAYTPGLLVMAGLLALVRPPRSRRYSPVHAKFAARVPALALVAVMVVSAAVNYRMPTTRTMAAPWNEKVAEATAQCRADPNLPFVVVFETGPFFVIIACPRVR